MAYEKEKSCALEAVIAAAKLAEKKYGQLHAEDIIKKKDSSPVTIIDYACQVIINRTLLKAFPEDSIMGEEEGIPLSLKDKILKLIDPPISEEEMVKILQPVEHFPSRYWIVDPIDGTRGYIGGGQYACALALIENKEIVLGILCCPRHEGGKLLFAIKGEGAFERALAGNGLAKLAVIDSLSLIYCESTLSSHLHSHADARRIAEKLHAHPEPFRVDSSVKYALVAEGKAAIYIRFPPHKEHREKVWDHAAGMVIVEEAGGKVSDLNGKPLDYSTGRTFANNYGLVVATLKLHPKVIKVISGEK